MEATDPRPGDGDGHRTDEAAAPGAGGAPGTTGAPISGDAAPSDATADAVASGGGQTAAGATETEGAAGEFADGDAAAADLGVGDPLEELRRERDEYLDALRRMQADFENYRKRIQRQQEETVARAAERLVTALLPALDAFDMAAAHLVGDEQASPGGLLQAAALLRDTLAKEGLEQVGQVGDPFDPNAHEAVEHTADDDGDGPVVDAVLRPGYRYHGRTVRPAMVKVRG
jgi:molecular chaperone GrpE